LQGARTGLNVPSPALPALAWRAGFGLAASPFGHQKTWHYVRFRPARLNQQGG
jgi:hypothetical protein